MPSVAAARKLMWFSVNSNSASLPTLVLLTGASGFIGSNLMPVLQEQGMRLRLLSRRVIDAGQDADVHVVPDGDGPGLDRAIAGVEVVCHLAGRAHVTARGQSTQRDFDEVNVVASQRLAEAAFRSGTRRFVFVSSIGAVGSVSRPGSPLTESAPCRPTTPYGLSKRRAEESLRSVASRHGAELVVVRPPLVHGPGAPGNLALLSRLVSRGIPLPLSGIENRRSLIHVRNLARVLAASISEPGAAGQIFHVRDRKDYSTPEIVEAAAHGTGRPARLFRAPLPVVQAAAFCTGRKAAFQQLTGWLQVDDRHVQARLGLTPIDLPLEIGSAG